MGEERKYVPLSQTYQTFFQSVRRRDEWGCPLHYLLVAGLRTGLDDYERGLRQK